MSIRDDINEQIYKFLADQIRKEIDRDILKDILDYKQGLDEILDNVDWEEIDGLG